MKEIKIYMHLQELNEKVRKYIPRVNGGYYFEIFFASNKVESNPFRVFNEQNTVDINQKIEIMNQCGESIEFWLKTYTNDQFIAAGELFLSDIVEGQDPEVDIMVESALFARLKLSIEVVENVIEKKIIVENDEDCLKKEEIDWEELERQKLEEERLQKEAEELEALKLAQAKKTIITVTDTKRDNETYF